MLERMHWGVETIGLLALELVGLAQFGSLALFGTVTVASVVGTVIATAAIVGLNMLLAKPSLQKPAVPDASDGTQTIKQPIPPRVFGYGRARIAGAYMFYEATTGGDSYDVVALHHGRITAILYHYLNDDLVLLNGSGVVTSVVGGNDSRYVSQVTIKTRLGAATETHYSEVASAFPTFWSSSHRGDGQASAMLKCANVALANFWTTYPHGLPKLSVVADLTPIYDPRDPAQSRTDPATWTSSTNPVLQIIDLWTSEDHGLGLDWDTTIAPVLDDLMVEADLCDEAVTLDGGGTEDRYTSSGWAHLNTDPADLLAAILLTCDGWLAEGADGTLKLWVGVYRTPEVTITDDHILGLTIDHGVPDEEVVNEIRFSYAPPANDYRDAAGIPWRDEADISERGKVRAQQLALTWVRSHTQARRLAKRHMSRYTASLRGTMVCDLYGLMAQGQRWIKVQSDTIEDLADAVLEVSRLKIDLAQGRVSFDWSLVNPNAIDAWDPETEEGTEPIFPGKLAVLSLPTPTGVVAASQNSATFRITLDDPIRPDLNFTVRYRQNDGSPGSWTTVNFSSYSSDGATVTLDLSVTPTDQRYDFEVATRNTLGNLSAWSTTVNEPHLKQPTIFDINVTGSDASIRVFGFSMSPTGISYAVQFRVGTGAWSSSYIVTSWTDSDPLDQFTVIGAITGGRNSVRVATRDSAGNLSAWSSPLSF